MFLLFQIYVVGIAGTTAAEKPLEFYKQRVYTSQDGLPQNSIFSITQTPDGFIWLSTNAGLARFDGVEFDVFNLANHPTLSSDICDTLLVDKNGALWITTQKGGIICYKNGVFEKTYTVAEGLTSNDARAILQSRSGVLWIGTTKGLNRLEKGKISVIHLPGTAASHNVRALVEDSKGQLWIGTTNGLLFLSKEGKRYTVKHAGLEGHFITALVIDPKNSLWVGTEGHGLKRMQLHWEPGDGQFSHTFVTENRLSSGLIASLYLDREDVLWIGTRDGGLNRLQDDRVTVFNTENGLSHKYVLSVFKDREGNLWIGTNGGGLNLLSDSKITTYNIKNGLTYDQVYGIYQDSRGIIWVGTFGFGVERIKDGQVGQPLTVQDGLPTNFILSICEDNGGYMWFGTYGGGAVRMKDEDFKTYTTRDGLTSDFVYGLYADRQGRLWAGTNKGGLHRFSNNRFTLYKKFEGKVRAFLEDSRGDLWIGTDETGLVRVRGKDGEVEMFNASHGLSSQDILAIFEDKTGTLWVATYGAGLNRYKNGHFKAIRQTDGLPHDIIYWILEDDSDHLWLSSIDGIFRVSLGELEAFFNGTSRNVTCTVFDEADGMNVRECNGGSQPSGWRTTDGRLWFITAAGVAVVDPSDTGMDTPPPPVAIKHVIIDEKSFTPRFELTAPPGKGDIEIQYTGLSFVVPERVLFKYKLEGYDEDWINAGTRRAAYYTNLAHGSYRFRVQARSHEGKWNEKGASLHLTIAPYLWQTWWFKILALLFILSLVRLFYLLKMRNIRVRQRELEQQVTERTQTLKSKTVELENKRATLEKINHIVKSINAEVDPKDILVSILKETAVLEGIERAGALVYDKSLDAYMFEAALGYNVNQLAPLRFSFREVENRYIKDSEEIFTDIFIAKHVATRPGGKKIKGVGLPKSMLILKIRTGDAVAGYLIFDDMEDENGFEKRDIELLKELKGHIASAFIKSKLLLELEAEREAAEAANHAKSMFLARMSHEIRTPMNSVIGFADMLQDTELNEEQKEFSYNISKCGEALLQLIDEILDFSRIEAGQLLLQPVDFDLRAMVSDICHLMRPRVGNKPVKISCRVEERIPAYVKSDAGRIRQVMVNLVGNAVKFTSAGEIELSMDIEEESGEELKLHAAVRDTGIGIAREQLGSIFEVFQQADGSITRQYGGTGLGLAISRQIALLLGGNIWVESQEGKGSTFHFTAWVEKSLQEPVRETPSPGWFSSKIARSTRQSVHILLAEDNPVNRKLARFMLTRGGYHLTMVNNGREAVDAYTSEPGKYDLILMDIQMPRMSGIEAAKEIRRIEKELSIIRNPQSAAPIPIPIIAMTAHAMKEDREKCLQAGMNDYISKPIKREVVFEVIKKWLSAADSK